ncbi:hypothetical protein BDZ89DRAFT_1163620 [Hymenopellis radicata]|nr:hypothetical protein BDZ89DRAFT_1163620 [Hymenopellis radicata]
MENPPCEDVPRRCSRNKCKNVLPDDWVLRQCAVCQASNLRYKKRKRDKNEEEERRPAPSAPVAGPSDASRGDRRMEDSDDDSDGGDNGSEYKTAPETYDGGDSMVCAIRDLFKEKNRIHFYGCYTMAVDPIVSMKERVRMLANEIWKVTGYRFFVRDHKSSQCHRKTRYWCCQDVSRKQKPHLSTKADAKRRQNVGMKRFPCNSRLNITCRSDGAGDMTISLRLVHEVQHIAYYDVSMPEGALDMIRTHMDFSTPSVLAAGIREKYPHVSAAQVHRAWSTMSETLWKRAGDQMESGRILLQELGDDVDYFSEIRPPDGVEQICFGMKRILHSLRGKVVEIGMDATYNTNKGHLELYSIMGEHDNAGFPLAYCLLTTATAVEQGKRTSALEAWATILRDRYGIIPQFVHLDKDMAEIGMAKRVWSLAKILICWWHLNRAVGQRLANEKLSTTPYRAKAAHMCFPFIDPEFVPPGDADASEREGGPDPDAMPRESDLDVTRPWALKIKLPAISSTAEKGNVQVSSDEGRLEEPSVTPHPSPVCNQSTALPPKAKNSKRTFCPKEYRTEIAGLIERHYCAHPFIPGEAHPSTAAIYEWAVRMMYAYCVERDLREVWAYLWENWYRPGRWELWARSTCPEMIAILKTTMILESHWRRIKEDFLHHFAMPRVDLLIWILVTKLAPNYYRRLDVLINPIGRYRELASWRKAFKKEWRRCETTPLTLPMNEKYQPDTEKWVCTCPYLHGSRFLVCKHLVQAVHPVPPIFFLEVRRNRVPPFWSHPSLLPLNQSPTSIKITETFGQIRGTLREDSDSDSGDEDVMAFTASRATFREQMSSRVTLLREFADTLEYQTQFCDQRTLDSVEREGGRLFRLAESCKSRESRFRSGTEGSPSTWEASTSKAMFFRPRPAPE